MSAPRAAPRLIIHGGAGNITETNLSLDRRRAFSASLYRIVRVPNLPSPSIVYVAYSNLGYANEQVHGDAV